jgi:hypothetical protein
VLLIVVSFSEGLIMARKSTRATNRKPALKAKPRPSAAKKSPAKNLSLAAGPPAARLLASPVGEPQPFSTKPSASGNQRGSSTTTGLKGTTQKFDDGSMVSEATENLTRRSNRQF